MAIESILPVIPFLTALLPSVRSKGLPASEPISATASAFSMAPRTRLPWSGFGWQAQPLLASSRPSMVKTRVHAVAKVSKEPIAKEDLLEHIRWLSHDKLKGRDSPSPGLDEAAGIIAEVCAASGLRGANGGNAANPYFQPFDLYGYTSYAQHRQNYEAKLKKRDGLAAQRTPMKYEPVRRFQYALHEDEYRRRAGDANFIGTNYTKWGGVNNVAAVFEGSDPKLKDEYILVSAHYDHIGERRWGSGDRIYNGADDNASGSAILLSVLPALAELKRQGKGPKRSIIFVWTAAEEKGLVGADYYWKNPLVSIKRTRAAINVDMVARLGAEHLSVIDIDKKKRPNLFRPIIADAGKRAGFSRIDHNIDEYLFRQDGGIWVKAGIPTIFLFEGLPLNPDYHGEDDEIEKIIEDNGGEKVHRVANLTLDLILQTANGDIS